MQRLFILCFLVLFGFACPAQQLVFISVDGPQQLASVFADENLTVHYYNEECVIATAHVIDAGSMQLLDENAFSDGPYYIVRCPKEEQPRFMQRESAHCQLVRAIGNKLIVKSLSKSFLPFSEDGMAVVSNAPARLPALRHSFPDVQQEDPNIRRLMDFISDDSLMATIRHLQNYGTRQWDSDSVYAAQNWLVSQYQDKGLSVNLHDIDSFWNISTSDNIIAIQRGVVYPDEYVFCGAHYDSFTRDSLAPGADDNASGTAGILEMARILSQYRFERSIVYCGWAAEECGLLGSEAYASEAQAADKDIWAYFNLDMTGYLEEGLPFSIPIVYISFSDSLAAYYKRVCRTYYPDMVVHLSWLPEGGDSDHSSFHRHGYQAIMPFEKSGHISPYIHSAADTIGLSVNSPFQMHRFTEMNLACVAILAGYIGGASVDETQPCLSVFPNPVRHRLNIESSDMQLIQIYNVFGQLVKKMPLSGENSVTIDMTDCSPGLYVVSVVAKTGTSTKNIVIE